MTKPPPASRVVMLRDGSCALLRPLVPEDKPRIQDGMKRMSQQTRFRRFLSPIREFTAAQLDQLTNLDYDDRMAWAAFPVDNLEFGLGIARYQRLPDDPTVAESAVVVVDSHQGLGLGTKLLTVLSRSAYENGIRRFRAFVLADNEPMIKILRSVGANMVPGDEGILCVDTTLPEPTDDPHDNATARVFKAVAGDQIPSPGVRFLHDDVLLKAVKAFTQWHRGRH